MNSHHGIDKFFFGDGRLVIAENGNVIVGFLWAHKRKISAPVEAEEMFINYIIIFESELHHHPGRIRKSAMQKRKDDFR